MRTVLLVLGYAVAISGIWSASSAAPAKDSYKGPSSIHFDARGVRAPTRSAQVNLRNGAVTVSGPCWPRTDCRPPPIRSFLLSPPDLAQFRSLAIEIKAEGLLDPVCIERQKKEAALADQRDREEWENQHPEIKGGPPTRLPYDPFNASFQLEGVGTVMSSRDYGNEKSEAHCVTQATKTLWDLIMGL